MVTDPPSVTSEEQIGAGNPDDSAQGDLLRSEIGPDPSIDDRPTIRVVLDGELDPHTAPGVQRQMDEAIDGGCQILVLDLARLRFIDSAGLRVVIGAHRRLAATGGELIIESPSDTARRLFEITGLNDHFTIRTGRS